jgi:hypothetical protein
MKPKFLFSIFASLMLLIWPGIGFSAAKDLVAA